MEADWEMEIGGDAPVIETRWAGFIDLAQEPGRIGELSEAQALPALGEALLALNRPASPFRSSKCDFWPSLESGTWDPDEMNAETAEALCASGCYIDLMTLAPALRSDPKRLAELCRKLCQQLHALPLPCSRADFLLRRAWSGIEPFENGFTLYLTACGATEKAAQERLSATLRTLSGWLGSVSLSSL